MTDELARRLRIKGLHPDNRPLRFKGSVGALQGNIQRCAGQIEQWKAEQEPAAAGVLRLSLVKRPWLTFELKCDGKLQRNPDNGLPHHSLAEEQVSHGLVLARDHLGEGHPVENLSHLEWPFRPDHLSFGRNASLVCAKEKANGSRNLEPFWQFQASSPFAQITRPPRARHDRIGALEAVEDRNHDGIAGMLPSAPPVGHGPASDVLCMVREAGLEPARAEAHKILSAS